MLHHHSCLGYVARRLRCPDSALAARVGKYVEDKSFLRVAHHEGLARTAVSAEEPATWTELVVVAANRKTTLVSRRTARLQ